jgi:histone-arginine methyltransferase CARM1
MIGDIARTSAYRKAILGNGAVAFQDKLVIDVGAGKDTPCCGRLLTKGLNYTWIHSFRLWYPKFLCGTGTMPSLKGKFDAG